MKNTSGVIIISVNDIDIPEMPALFQDFAYGDRAD